VFQGAYDIAGGGSYGEKDHPLTKEQADYNLKYLTAVALLDGAVGPEQLESERVRRADVQELLERVDVTPAADLTAAYPQRTSARVRVVLHDGREHAIEVSDYEGSPTNPLSWERVVEKFHWLAEPFCDEALRADIVDAVEHLDDIPIAELAMLLGAAAPLAQRPRTRHRL
jgi:2-methylcitrate dehydratase PrpD